MKWIANETLIRTPKVHTHTKQITQRLKESQRNLSFEERHSFIKEQPLRKQKSKAKTVFWGRSYNMARVLNVSWSANGSNSMKIKNEEESAMVQKRFTKTKTPSTNCHTTHGQNIISSLGQDAIDSLSRNVLYQNEHGDQHRNVNNKSYTLCFLFFHFLERQRLSFFAKTFYVSSVQKNK